MIRYGLMLALAAGSATAQEGPWAPIRRAFGQDGERDAGYFRINLPRSDLTVRIGDDVLSPGFEFTSYVGFVPVGTRGVLAVGEVILRDDEVPAALAEAHRQGVQVTAVHNHLIGETPRIVYVHVLVRGPAAGVAAKLRAVFARTATPLGPERPAVAPTADWTAIDAVLGPHAEADGSIAEYAFPRRERLTIQGVPVRSSGLLETASEAVFQDLGGGKVASTGELFVLPGEVDAVIRALDEHGLQVTAVHHHMLAASPTMYWIHWYATGSGAALARGVAAALLQMNSVRKSQAESKGN